MPSLPIEEVINIISSLKPRPKSAQEYFAVRSKTLKHNKHHPIANIHSQPLSKYQRDYEKHTGEPLTWGILLGTHTRSKKKGKVDVEIFKRDVQPIIKKYQIKNYEELEEFALNHPDLWPRHFYTRPRDQYGGKLISADLFPENEDNHHLRHSKFPSFTEFLKDVRSKHFLVVQEYKDHLICHRPNWPAHPERTYKVEFEKNGKWIGLLGNVGSISLSSLYTWSVLKFVYGLGSIVREFKIHYPCGHYGFIDFYLPEKNMAIEVDGSQHRRFNDRFHRDLSDFYQQRKRDTKKEQWCRDHNISLIRIPALFECSDLHCSSLTQFWVNHLGLKQLDLPSHLSHLTNFIKSFQDQRWRGETLQAKRKQCGMTQRDVASLIGVRQSSISRLENNKRRTTPIMQAILDDVFTQKLPHGYWSFVFSLIERSDLKE